MKTQASVGYKVDTAYWVPFLIKTPIFEWLPQRQVMKRDWTVCSKYDKHSRLNSQHHWSGGGEEGGTYMTIEWAREA